MCLNLLTLLLPPWCIFPILGWGLGVAIHGAVHVAILSCLPPHSDPSTDDRDDHRRGGHGGAEKTATLTCGGDTKREAAAAHAKRSACDEKAAKSSLLGRALFATADAVGVDRGIFCACLVARTFGVVVRRRNFHAGVFSKGASQHRVDRDSQKSGRVLTTLSVSVSFSFSLFL